jgi:hypothetical protein
MGWLIVLGVVAVIWLFTWLNGRLSELQQQAKKYTEIKQKLDHMTDLEKREVTLKQDIETREAKFSKDIETREKKLKQDIEIREEKLKQDIETREKKLKAETETREFQLQRHKKELDLLVKEKTQGFPWLESAYSECLKLYDLEKAYYLKNKTHPAIKASEELRQIAKERREAQKAASVSKHLLDYSRYLAPWLDDYIGIESKELDEIINEIHSSWQKKEQEFDEEVKRHYGPSYENLTQEQKLQKRLDWYWGKPNKTDWQIGRDYERYIGYLYENKGWRVSYQGKDGFEDLGRDLIGKKGDVVEIIQCKRWAQNKQIHEKNIYYLLGTTIEYYLDNFTEKENLQFTLFPELIKKGQVIPKLISTVEISDRAKKAANALGVVIEKTQFPNINPPYPSVKCNIARRTEEKIYHLPFDQQYDTVLVEEERFECFANTIAEAEAKGFRHAYRWKGEADKQ